MNFVDLIVLAVILLSALLAFARGLVREVLSIGAWVGAGFFAVWAQPFVVDRFEQSISNKDVADPASYVAMYIVALIFLSIIVGMTSALVNKSVLGGVDRTLGMVFGVLRGLVIVSFAYLAGGLITAPDHWPAPVQQARSLPYAYQGARILAGLLPESYRPALTEPASKPFLPVEDLLHATPQGHALARP